MAYVADDTDNRDHVILFITKPDAMSEGIAVREQNFGKRLIKDCDARAVAAITAVEETAGEKRNLQCTKVIGACRGRDNRRIARLFTFCCEPAGDGLKCG